MPAKLTPQDRANLISTVMSGRTMAEAAGVYGVSRQYVGQIIRDARLTAPTSRSERHRRKQGVVALVKKGLRDEAIRGKLGITIGAVVRTRLAAGLGMAGETAKQRAARQTRGLKAHMDAGGSIRSYATENGVCVATANRVAKALGLETIWGKWRDRSDRLVFVIEQRKAKACWPSIALMLSEREGKHIGVAGLHQWVKRNAPHLIVGRVRRRLAA